MPEPLLTETLQICVVVRDLEASLKTYVEGYGIGPWEIYEFNPETVERLEKDGETADIAFRLAVTMVGSVQWELVQPLDDRSIYAEFLASKGEGLHHVAVGGTPYLVARAEGPYVFDVEGRRYIDLVQSYGAIILGHAHPKVVEAVTAAAADGTSYGAPTAREMKLAETIAAETGARVGGDLYGDTLGPGGSSGDTYVKMEAANMEAMFEAFSQSDTRNDEGSVQSSGVCGIPLGG